MHKRVYNRYITKTPGQNTPQQKEENKMKKIISLILVAVMTCFALVSCNFGDDEENLAAAYEKILEGLSFDDSACTETLTVAMSPDFAPMEFYDTAKTGNDAIVGFDVLLAKYLAKELNMKLVIKPMSFDATQAAVQSGNVDLGISGFSWTEERAENYEISNQYIAGENETEQAIITLKKNEGKLTKVEDFDGLKIGYQGASLQEDLVKEVFTDTGADIDHPYGDIGTAVEALKSGKIDAIAVAKGNGDAIIANSSDTIAFSGYEFEVDEKSMNNVILIQKGNVELLNKVNTALAKALENDYYSEWYEAVQIYSAIKTLDELGYDDEGNKITE